MNAKGSQIDGMLVGFQFYFILFYLCVACLILGNWIFNTTHVGGECF
jgi:hypothetical protein